ncbi:MAG: hypothetical protein IJ529_04840 [Alphaproteobacteria bacterium]|nr:hypothetical protein [Alphaproteobacteria bacterium]MBQ8677773.1 hypothetical protein [Alphaproteobacteria bacterium]
MAEQNDNTALKKISQLFCLNRFDTARREIMNAAQVPWNQRTFATSKEMDDYILQHTTNPEIQQLVALDKAFTHLCWWSNNTTNIREENINESRKMFAPLFLQMDPKDVLKIKYWQSQLYMYPGLSDDMPRYQLLNDLIKNYPATYSDNDAMMKHCANQVNYLKISPIDRYSAIKMAQKKSSRDVKYTYDEMLAPLAEKSFDLLLEKADNDEKDYLRRKEIYEQAYDVIDDINIRKEFISSFQSPGNIGPAREYNKHKRRLLVLSRMHKLHTENGHREDADRITEKKNKLCSAFYRKHPQFKKRISPSHDIL